VKANCTFLRLATRSGIENNRRIVTAVTLMVTCAGALLAVGRVAEVRVVQFAFTGPNLIRCRMSMPVPPPTSRSRSRSSTAACSLLHRVRDRQRQRYVPAARSPARSPTSNATLATLKYTGAPNFFGGDTLLIAP